MSDLADLKRRVEEAQEDETWELIRLVGEHLGVRDSEDLWWSRTISPLLAADAYLDATVALIERVKPGARIGVDIERDRCDAVIMEMTALGFAEITTFVEGLKTGPLALLAALLSACEGGVK